MLELDSLGVVGCCVKLKSKLKAESSEGREGERRDESRRGGVEKIGAVAR